MSQTLNKTLLNEKWPLASIFWAFTGLHVLIWTALPFLVRYTLPMDSMEGYVWGQQLEWGYDKNPFVNGWMTALAVRLGGDSGWMIYLFSQLSVALCFWAVWQLGKKMLPPVYALLGVLLFYQALCSNTNKSQTLLAWLGCGVFAGLSMMTKYYTVVLLVPMTVFLF